MPDLEIALLRTFVAVVDTGGLTSAGRKVGRTQPAITHQIKRLEERVGRALFGADRRRLTLTRDGEVLLNYARSLLSLNDEARARFSAPEIEGRVVLGTPDLYAAYLLPEILGSFARAYPSIEIELRCTRSVHLYAALQRGEIDVALMTDQPDFQNGETVRREQRVWVAGPRTALETETVLPLAVLPTGSVYRQRALEALNLAGRKWTIASISDSIAGLQAAVYAGLAISVFPACAVARGMRTPGKAQGLPDMPALRLVLHRKSGDGDKASDHLADYIAEALARVRPFSVA